MTFTFHWSTVKSYNLSDTHTLSLSSLKTKLKVKPPFSMQIYPNTYEHFLTEVITALDLNVLTFSILEVSVSAKRTKAV